MKDAEARKEILYLKEILAAQRDQYWKLVDLHEKLVKALGFELQPSAESYYGKIDK